MSLESFERFPLLFGPSPIQKLERLTKHAKGCDTLAPDVTYDRVGNILLLRLMGAVAQADGRKAAIGIP